MGNVLKSERLVSTLIPSQYEMLGIHKANNSSRLGSCLSRSRIVPIENITLRYRKR